MAMGKYVVIKKAKTSSKRSSRRLTRRIIRRQYKSSYALSKQNALGFSRSQLIKVRYVQQVQLNPASTAGSTAYILYSSNSINQPNVATSASVSTTVSHQPLAHDQWSAIYNHYCVIGSKCKVQLIPNNSINPTVSGGIVSMMLQDSATPITVATTVLESGRASYRQLAPNGTSPTFLSKSYSTKKFFKLQNIKDNMDNVGSLFGGNPDEQAYYTIQFFPIDLTVAGTLGPLMIVTIDYTVLLTGPKDLSQS